MLVRPPHRAAEQTEVAEEETGLVWAPVEPAVWVEKHRGLPDDTPEER